MSQIPETNPSTTNPQPAPAATVDAAGMLQLLDRMEAMIPDFLQPDATRVQLVSGNAKFASELLPPTISAVTSYEPMRKINLFNVDAGRSALAYRDQLRPVAQRMAAITLALSYSINQKLATSATEALQTYQWAKRHLKQPDGGGAQTYVDEMQRVVGKTINRRPKKQAPPATAPPAQGFMSSALAGAGTVPDEDDIFEQVREEAAKDVKK